MRPRLAGKDLRPALRTGLSLKIYSRLLVYLLTRHLGPPWSKGVRLRANLYTLYIKFPNLLNITEARAHLATVIEQVRSEHEPVYLTRRGRRVAALIDADDLQTLVGLAEDMADIRAAAAARAEVADTGAEPIPWEDVKADLGLS